MATPEEKARRIFGERAGSYATSRCHTDPEVLARVVELARPEPSWHALDLGTGTGHTAFALAPHVARVIATDITPEMLAEGERLREQKGLWNVDFRLADVHALPFQDRSFDLVTCRRAAHHFSDIVKGVAEMARVLRVGGRLVVDDRSVPEDDFVDRAMNELDTYHDRSHVRQYRASEWVAMLEGAGLVVERVEPYTRHRPIGDLTRDVDPADAALVHATLRGWSAEERVKMNYVEQGGEPYIDHWYVLIAAAQH